MGAHSVGSAVKTQGFRVILVRMQERSRHDELDDPLRPETISAVFSATMRRGEWLPAEEVRARALFGNVTLDLRDALLAPGVTTIECFAFCGAVEIIVPPKLEVELAAQAFLGAVEQRNSGGKVGRFIASQIRRALDPDGHRHHRDAEPADADPEDAPLVRIEGRAICGAIIVRVR
jgi:cell wall-active antibiotic response 4TMS protein YvqF